MEFSRVEGVEVSGARIGPGPGGLIIGVWDRPNRLRKVKSECNRGPGLWG